MEAVIAGLIAGLFFTIYYFDRNRRIVLSVRTYINISSYMDKIGPGAECILGIYYWQNQILFEPPGVVFNLPGTTLRNAGSPGTSIIT